MIDQKEMDNVMTVGHHKIILNFYCTRSILIQSLYKMLEGMGNRPSGDPNVRAKDIFALIDVNQDGTLTKDEFIKGKQTPSLLAGHFPISGCQTDDELMTLLEKLFETLLECRVNLHGVLTKLKIKYLKK